MSLAPLLLDLAQPEQHVIVEIVDEVADTSLVHLPLAQTGGFRFDRYDFPPATWSSACGRVRSGSVYVRGGMLEGAPVCPDCEAAQ
jgi:hypothetical protein